MINLLVKVASICLLFSNPILWKKNRDQDKPIQVQVTNWGGRSIMQHEHFFDGVHSTIIDQVGLKEHDSIMKYIRMETWPDQMQFGMKQALDSNAAKKLNFKLNELKLYKVATFRYIFQGKDWGNYVIVKVPYEDNKSWDGTAKWNVVYFLFEEKDLKELK